MFQECKGEMGGFEQNTTLGDKVRRGESRVTERHDLD